MKWRGSSNTKLYSCCDTAVLLASGNTRMETEDWEVLLRCLHSRVHFNSIYKSNASESTQLSTKKKCYFKNVGYIHNNIIQH